MDTALAQATFASEMRMQLLELTPSGLSGFASSFPLSVLHLHSANVGLSSPTLWQFPLAWGKVQMSVMYLTWPGSSAPSTQTFLHIYERGSSLPPASGTAVSSGRRVLCMLRSIAVFRFAHMLLLRRNLPSPFLISASLTLPHLRPLIGSFFFSLFLVFGTRD